MPTAEIPRRAHPLNRDRILDEASALLRDEGAKAFSMRRLAARLGVTPMALYKWFDSRDELLGALTERVLDGPVAADDASSSWSDRVVRVAFSLREQLLENRELLQLVGAPRQLSGMLAITSDQMLGLVREIGYDGVAAVEAYRILFWSILSHCLVAEVGAVVPAFLGEYDAERVVRGAIDSAGIPLPNVAALRPAFGPTDRDTFFEHVVRSVAAGLEARVG